MSSNSAFPGKGARTAAEPFVFAPPNGAAPAPPPSEKPQPNVDFQVEQRAYEKGLIEGETRARGAFEKSLTDLHGSLSATLLEFSLQREGYFQRVEGEVVQLALSIARKILHREAQIDPLLLTGIVRVALDTLNEGTKVRLRTNPQEVLFWREHFSQASETRISPELVGDASLDPGCCVLETDLGSTRISMETQLKEIEQGFLDLLEQRPRLRE